VLFGQGEEDAVIGPGLVTCFVTDNVRYELLPQLALDLTPIFPETKACEYNNSILVVPCPDTILVLAGVTHV
jgi:hypothetical protein